MFRKVAAVYPLDDLKLLVWFEGGEVKTYSMAALVHSHESFAPLADRTLFASVRVDAGGYGISWNDDIDLAGNELYDNGVPFDLQSREHRRVVSELVSARQQSGLSQGRLEEASGVRQPVIARMESGSTSPQLDTMLKVLAPMGKTLRVVDLDVS